MTPATDERIASIIRALTEVVLPHLPPEASLAQEQVQLAVGHLQILRLQFDGIAAFEQGELDDNKTLARALAHAIDGGPETSAAVAAVRDCAARETGSEVRAELRAVNAAIEGLVAAVSADGAAGAKAQLSRIILEHEAGRVEKDRRWFLPYGFDTMEPTT